MKRLAKALRVMADRLDAPSVITYHVHVDAGISPDVVRQIRRGIQQQVRREGRAL